MAHSHDWHKVQALADEPLYSSAPQRPEDIIFEGSDVEDSPTKTFEKRQRYEEAAKRYLQGKTPVLQSTSLRGPFGQETGWINPWRYRPRNQPDWWQPGSEDMLFTRANVLKWAKDCGLGHLAPAEALARCKAEAKAEAEAMRKLGSAPGHINSTVARKGSDVMREADREREGGDTGEDSDVMEVTANDWTYSDPPDNTGFQPETNTSSTPPEYSLISTERSNDETLSSLPDNATRVTKRAVSSQWLKSNISKRSRVGSPDPVSTPTPISNAPVKNSQRKRQMPSRSDTARERSTSSQDPESAAYSRISSRRRSVGKDATKSTMDEARPRSRRVFNQPDFQLTAPVSDPPSDTQTPLRSKRKRVPGLGPAQAIWESLQPKSRRGQDVSLERQDSDVGIRGGFTSSIHRTDSSISKVVPRENDADIYVRFEDQAASKHGLEGQIGNLDSRKTDRQSKPKSLISQHVHRLNHKLKQEQTDSSVDIGELYEESQPSSPASVANQSYRAQKILKNPSKPDRSISDIQPNDPPRNHLVVDPMQQTPALHGSQNSFITDIVPSTRGIGTFQFQRKRKSKVVKSRSTDRGSTGNADPTRPEPLETVVTQDSDDAEGRNCQDAPQLSLGFSSFSAPQRIDSGDEAHRTSPSPTPGPQATERLMQTFDAGASSPNMSSLENRSTIFQTPRAHTPKIPTPNIPTPFAFGMSFGAEMFLDVAVQPSSVAQLQQTPVPRTTSSRAFTRATSFEPLIPDESPKRINPKVATRDPSPASLSPSKLSSLKASTKRTLIPGEVSSLKQAQQDLVSNVPTPKVSAPEATPRSRRSDSSWDMLDDSSSFLITTPLAITRDQGCTPICNSQVEQGQQASQETRAASTPMAQILPSQVPSTSDPSQRTPITVYVSGKLCVPPAISQNPPRRSRSSPTRPEKSSLQAQESPEKSQKLPKHRAKIPDPREADLPDLSTQSYDSAFATSPLKGCPSPLGPHPEASSGQPRTELDIVGVLEDMEDSEDVANIPFRHTPRSTSNAEQDLSPFNPPAETHAVSCDDTDDLDIIHEMVPQNRQSPELEILRKTEQSPFQSSYLPGASQVRGNASMDVINKGIESPEAVGRVTPTVQEPQSPWASDDIELLPVALPTEPLDEPFVDDGLENEPSTEEGFLVEDNLTALELDWQRVDQPTTQDDEIRPFRDFMTPSPEKEDAGLHEAVFQSTQMLYDEANNPWKSSLRKTASGKPRKRVSFGVLPLDERGDSQLTLSSRKPRPSSPPPSTIAQDHDIEDLDEEGDITTKENTLANTQKLTTPKYKPVLTGNKYNVNESPFKRNSPPLEAMAEAFIAADRGASTEQDQYPVPFVTSTRHLKTMNEASTNFVSQESVEDSDAMDSFSITPTGKVKKAGRHNDDFSLDDIMGDIEGWSVEAELRQANAEANAGKRGGTKTSRRRERLSRFGNVWS